MEHRWKQHYIAGETGDYHGDMARAFARMLLDPCCSPNDMQKIQQSINIHCRLERLPHHIGRKWFCELFGTDAERNPDVSHAALTREQLIRQWWTEYYAALSDPINRLGKMDRVNRLTDALQAAGIIVEGLPMPMDGAEDIAAVCDRLKVLR